MVGVLNLGADPSGALPAGDDEQGGPPAVRVQHLDDLGGGVLEQHGVQRLLPAKEGAGNQQHDHIAAENVVPGVHILPLRQGDGDKVGAAAGHPHPQAQAAREAVDDPAKNADEQLVLRDGEGGDQVGEDAGHHNGQAGVQGEPLAHQLKADEGGHGVQGQIDGAERQLHPAKLQGAPLDQAGNPGKAAGEQVARRHKAFQVDGDNKRGQADRQHTDYKLPQPVLSVGLCHQLHPLTWPRPIRPRFS